MSGFIDRFAISLLAFRPLTLEGRPFRIYVTREARPIHRRLVLVYRSAAGRRYALSQGVSWESRSAFAAFARDVANRDPCGSRAATLRLADGNIALLIEAQDRRVLNFKIGNVSIQLLGESMSFSRVRAIALAHMLAK